MKGIFYMRLTLEEKKKCYKPTRESKSYNYCVEKGAKNGY